MLRHCCMKGAAFLHSAAMSLPTYDCSRPVPVYCAYLDLRLPLGTDLSQWNCLPASVT